MFKAASVPVSGLKLATVRRGLLHVRLVRSSDIPERRLKLIFHEGELLVLGHDDLLNILGVGEARLSFMLTPCCHVLDL